MTLPKLSALPSPAAQESSYAHIFHSQHMHVPPTTLALIDTYTAGRVSHDDLIQCLGRGLRHEFCRLGGVHLTHGDTLMLLSSNSIAWHVVLHGSAAAGINVSPANVDCTAVELLQQFEDSGSKVLATHLATLPLVLAMFRLRNVSEADARRRIIVIDWTSQAAVPQGFTTTMDLMNNDVWESQCTEEQGSSSHEILVEAAVIGVEPQGRALPKAYSVLRPISKGGDTFIAQVHQWIAMPKEVADKTLQDQRRMNTVKARL